jgi:hypothetical protein
MSANDYIDPKGYWADPSRNIRRLGGEQELILTAAEECSQEEWLVLLAGLGSEENEE